MAQGQRLDRSVRPRKEIERSYKDSEAELEDEVPGDEQGSDSENASTDEGAEEDDESGIDQDSDTSPEDEPDEPADLKEISFGALAQAQADLGPPSKKRKLAEASPSAEDLRERSWKNDHREPKSRPSRPSKHAPAVQSSRRAVSRRLDVFDPSPSLKSRDPRFDPLIQSSSANDPTASIIANKNYSFLTSYQADEILALKSQIKKSKSPDDAATLKRQLMSLEAKLRRAEALNTEKDILQKHKAEEREAIKSGAKEQPYFLKKSDVRKEVLTQRFEGMSKKARDKAVERKRKRDKGKESRDMPWTRRERATE
jgi:ribosomal RNA-processing protein 36